MGGQPAALNIGSQSTFGVGGTFITSNPMYTVNAMYGELAGAVAKLATANVLPKSLAWFLHPRTFWFLATALNSIGLLIFPELMKNNLLWGYPVFQSTQIPINYSDQYGVNQDLSVIFLAKMDEALLLESSDLEITVSQEGATYDPQGNLHSLFAEDSTGYRAIMRHDFLLRHAAAVSIVQGVRWAPTFS